MNNKQTPFWRWLTKRSVSAICLLLISLIACKHADTVVPGTDPIIEQPDFDPNGLVCALGEPVADAAGTTEMIGPAGGTLTSEDGTLHVEIPAGALSNQEAVRIVPIINTNPTAYGSAYRLEPHGVTFAKPVRLTFTYSDDELTGTVAEGLQIAYQTQEGVWMAVAGRELNKQAGTVSINTTHFSDWTYFSYVHLDPRNAAVQPGGTVSMKVYATLIEEEYLAQLIPLKKDSPVVALHEDKTVPVSKWDISAGPGSLATSGAGHTNTYMAPATIDKPTLATVTAQVKASNNEFLLLIANVMIMQEGILYRFDRGPWIHRPGTASIAGGQGITISSGGSTSEKSNPLMITINLMAFAGNRNVRLNWEQASFTAVPTATKLPVYYATSCQGTSPGELVFDYIEYTPTSARAPLATTGSFSVLKAGEFRDVCSGNHRIEGFFAFGPPK